MSAREAADTAWRIIVFMKRDNRRFEEICELAGIAHADFNDVVRTALDGWAADREGE